MGSCARKIRLSVALGLLAAPLTPLPAGATPPPTPEVFSATVPGSGRSFTTPVVRAPGTFDLAGLSYDGPEADVELRTSDDGRTFTPWQHAPSADAEGPDLGSPERRAQHTTQPLWTGGARYVQYRVDATSGPVRNLRLQAVDAKGHGESLVGRLARQARGLLGRGGTRADAITDEPAIVTRAEWGADEDLRRDDHGTGTVRVAFVHHTVNVNDYSPSEARALIRGIYAYHVRSNGWDDIGYNFLVDRFGTVYEGRHGSIERAVIGAHTEGFNASSVGVALLGTHSDSAPTQSALDAVAQLLAWRLDVAHVRPTGRTEVVSAGSRRFPEGARVTLNNISGHRDAGQTQCPGQLAYNELASIREAVDGMGRPKIYLDGVARITGSQRGGYTSPTTWPIEASDPVGWNLAISHYALGAVRTMTSSEETTAPPRWDGRDDSGRPLPGGTYTVDVSATGTAGTARAATTSFVLEPSDEPKPAARLAGDDRYGTASAVSREVAPSATDVVVASGETAHLVDSLVAAPFAELRSAPLLLTGKTALPPPTVAELDRLKPTTAWIVGGTAAVPEVIADELAGRGITVRRLSGPDAFSTAAEVARAMGPPRPGAIVVAREAAHLVDGLAASGTGAGLGRPVLLVTHSSVPAVTAQTLRELLTLEVWAIGGEAAISDEVVAELRARRVSGSDRYGTAAAVAEAASSAGLVADVYVVASGQNANLVDALSGGAFARPVLLTARSTFPKATWDVLYGHRSTVLRAWVLGGTAAIATVPLDETRHAINGA